MLFKQKKEQKKVEEEEKNEESSDDFGEEFKPHFSEDHIGSFHDNTDWHVEDAENDGQLHFDVIDQGQLVLREAPNWIETNWVCA